MLNEEKAHFLDVFGYLKIQFLVPNPSLITSMYFFYYFMLHYTQKEGGIKVKLISFFKFRPLI